MAISKVLPAARKPQLLILLLVLSMVAFFFLIVFFISRPALALDETGCLKCHATLNATKVNSEGRVISLRIDENDVNSGAHRSIDCTVCHTTNPHSKPPALTKLSSAEKCGSCHQFEFKQHLDSIHGQQLQQGNADVATCVDCHSPKSDAHSVIRTLEPDAPTYKKNIAETCAKCHNNPGLMSNYGIVDRVYESYMRSFHGKAMTLGSADLSRLNAATCTNCHGTHNIMAPEDPNSPVAGKENLLKTCEQCHPGAGTEFVAGFLGHKEASPQHVPAAYYVERFFAVFLYSVVGVGVLVMVGAVIGFSRRRWKE